jgi:hypothetical protein
MKLSHSFNITIDNNAFFIGHKFIVYAEYMFLYSFTNNVMIAALDRISMQGASMTDDVSCYNQWTFIDFNIDQNLVQNNLCQGSGG